MAELPKLTDPLFSEVNVRRVDNKIYIYDGIDNKTQMVVMSIIDDIVSEFKAKHEKTARLFGMIPEVIEVHLNSPGGDVFASFSIYNYLKTLPIQTIGIVDGRAFSGASIILCGCTHRVMSENDFVLCHQLRSGVVGTAGNIEDTAENVKEIQAKMKSIYLSETKIPPQVLDEMLKRDIYLDGKKCLEYGLIDELQPVSPNRFEKKKPQPKKQPPKKTIITTKRN